jgi:hypothetical protein
MTQLWDYKSTAGPLEAPPARWPADSGLSPASGGSTLLVFAHPRCTCTSATLGELATLLARATAPVTTYVVFSRPPEVEAGWERTESWDAAQTIPGVSVLSDPGGAEARRFHVQTSGETVLYDPSGELAFFGGITGARGHRGDNVGRARVLSLLARGHAERDRSPVFGCGLWERASGALRRNLEPPL